MPTPIEDKFIVFMRPFSGEHDIALNTVQGYEFSEARLMEKNYAYYYRVTPRGADLLATADAIDYDPTTKPAPAVEATRPCADCEGEGRQRIPALSGFMAADPEDEVTWDMTCTGCEGKCVLLEGATGMPMRMLSPFGAQTRHYMSVKDDYTTYFIDDRKSSK